MITSYQNQNGRLAVAEQTPADALWLDLFNPTDDDIKTVEAVLGIALPSTEDTKLLASADRSYSDGAYLVLTMAVLARDEDLYPFIDDITFIVSDQRLVTLRRSDPLPISRYARHAADKPQDLRGLRQSPLRICPGQWRLNVRRLQKGVCRPQRRPHLDGGVPRDSRQHWPQQ
jgi:Mg2+ and Co2+ transporter CorA